MAADADLTIALVALDQLDTCGQSPAAVALLTRTVADETGIAHPRTWHREAHALLALASAAPASASPVLPHYAASPIWQVRVYAARAAVRLKDRVVLDKLAADSDARVANAALVGAGDQQRPDTRPREPALPAPTADDLRRLASPRAVITIREVGRVEVALLTSEAPASVLRFAQLAEAGYYDGLSFDRIAPNAIVQAGRRGSDDASYPRLEAGTWPNVRGVMALSMPDTDDAQFFFNMVDNPRFDHRYTVFAQVLNGADVIDQILEGDIIQSIAIVP
jgi:cyclophilin family peptidyl-prolyl cis-trans isomerase